MNNIGLYIRKYSVPAIFTIVGLIVLIYGFVNDQSGSFIFSAAMMLVAGILSGLFSMGKLRPPVVIGTGIVFGLISLVLIFLSYQGVSSTLKAQEDGEICYETAKQNLTDIRFLQKTHKEQHGLYIDNWDDLIDFAYNGTMPSLVSQGSVPKAKITPEERDFLYGDKRPIDNNMTEDEAYRLSKWKEGPRYDSLFSGFIRDTIPVSIMETKFQNKAYRESRQKADLGTFNPKDLPYIPFTNKKDKWKIEVADSITVGEIKGPALLVSGKLPFSDMGSSEVIKMSFGSLTTFDLDGSWEKE